MGKGCFSASNLKSFRLARCHLWNFELGKSMSAFRHIAASRNCEDNLSLVGQQRT